MKKYFKNKQVFFIVAVLIVLMTFFAYVFSNQQTQNKSSTQSYNATPVTQKSSENISYKGKENIDALTLLRQNATISLDQSGMVSSVNGRKADSVKHEYWAFYVNGKLAAVGPTDYNTKNTDLIEWKIDKY